MDFVTFPSFRPDRSCVQLADFLGKVPDNNWIWSVFNFYGHFNKEGPMLSGVSYEEFEALTHSEPIGYIMEWFELKKFANSINQTYDCLAVAAQELQDISGDGLDKNSYSSCEVVIEAFDSTEWSVWARDKKLMQNLVSAF